MYTAKLIDMLKGWIVGNFDPSIYKTNDVEVAVKSYKAGDYESFHFHKIATEITTIISGIVEMNGIRYSAGDIVVIEPGDATDFLAVTDAVNAVVKLPGATNDKYLVDAPSVGNTLEKPVKSEKDYINMQKRHYEDDNICSANIVGNYSWHEQFPYETFLLYKFGDIRTPVMKSFSNKRALDFACGPGRMIKRMRKIFAQVDGCDISERLLKEAKENVPESSFYLTNGNDLGNVPKNYYDFIYCTISMQHIASHSIRMNIIKNMRKALKRGGCVTLQMAYHPDFPYPHELNQCHARYLSDDFDAQATNGRHDVGIGKTDLPDVRKDLESIFDNVSIWFSNINNYFDDLRGAKHGRYWASDWIYVSGYKK